MFVRPVPLALRAGVSMDVRLLNTEEASVDITAHVIGTVWKIEKPVGAAVEVGDAIVILESMKMEVPIESPVRGHVRELRCAHGDVVEEGDVLAVVG